jgi:hypothetical protein
VDTGSRARANGKQKDNQPPSTTSRTIARVRGTQKNNPPPNTAPFARAGGKQKDNQHHDPPATTAPDAGRHTAAPAAAAGDYAPSPVALRRRVAAAKARRQRLLRIDVGLGVLLALLTIVIVPGLAIVALIALLALLAGAVSLAVERLAARSRRRRG